MIKIVPFAPEHLDQVEKRWCYADDEGIDSITLGLYYSGNSHLLSLVSDDGIVAILGGSLIWQGNMFFWAILSELVLKYPKDTHKTIKKLIESYARGLNLRRGQIDVRADFDEGNRWAEALGFEFEGTMKKYGPGGADHNLYARLF